MFIKKSEAEIIKLVSSKNLNNFGSYLLSGTIHGNPGIPTSEISRIEKIIIKTFDDKYNYEFGKKLLARNEYTSRTIGIHLIELGWPEHQEVLDIIQIGADDSDWIVRECAAGTFARLLQKDFKYFSKLFAIWAKSKNTNIKRAIALAVKYDSKSRELIKWKSYFRIIDPLMKESAEYIQKNLGPFAIGDGLIKSFPDEVINACNKWALSKNENTRWNTAMIFTAAASRKLKKDGNEILKILINDSVPKVSRAAKKGQLNLNRKL